MPASCSFSVRMRCFGSRHYPTSSLVGRCSPGFGSPGHENGVVRPPARRAAFVAAGSIVDADRLGHDPGGLRVIGLDRERRVHVVVICTSADHGARRPGALQGTTLPLRRSPRARRSASGRLVGLQSMVRSLGIIVRLTLRRDASVPFGLGFNQRTVKPPHPSSLLVGPVHRSGRTQDRLVPIAPVLRQTFRAPMPRCNAQLDRHGRTQCQPLAACP